MWDARRGSLEGKQAESHSTSSGLVSPRPLCWEDWERAMPKAPCGKRIMIQFKTHWKPKCQSLVLQVVSEVVKGEEHASQRAIDLLRYQPPHRWHSTPCL